MPWVKPESPAVIYDAVKAHCPHASLYSSNEGGANLSDALDWAADVSGDDGLIVFAGSLANFYRFIKLGS